MALLLLLSFIPIASADFDIEKGVVITPSATKTNFIMGFNGTYLSLYVYDDCIYLDNRIIKVIAYNGTQIADLNVTIAKYNLRDVDVKFIEEGNGDLKVEHEIGLFLAGKYTVTVDGDVYGTFTTNDLAVLSFSVNLSFSTHTIRITKYTPSYPPGGGEEEEETPPQEPEDIYIPPVKPPEVPEGYSIPQMYKMHGLQKDITVSNNGVKVAVIGTGAYPRQFTTREGDVIDLTKVQILSTSGYPSGIDDNGHDTLTNAQIAYAIQYFSPNSVQYSIKALDETGTASVDTVLEAFDIARSYDVDIICISAGSIGFVGDRLDMKVRECSEDGIVVVASAGNYGPYYGTITSPALSPDAIAVGAVNPNDVNNPYDDEVTVWSSRGPVDSVVKPDVVAGGESVRGPYLDDVEVLSGTSFAAPTVAGGITYMISVNKPKLNLLEHLYFWNKGIVPDLVKESIIKTSRVYSNDVYAYGHGLPDFVNASAMLSRMATQKIQQWFFSVLAIFGGGGMMVVLAKKRY